MLVHRAMMSVLALSSGLYSFHYLPENISILIIMLLPFFVALIAYTFDKERLNLT